jgi:hypothetical protein
MKTDGEHAHDEAATRHGLPTSSEGAKRYGSHVPDAHSQGNEST